MFVAVFFLFSKFLVKKKLSSSKMTHLVNALNTESPAFRAVGGDVGTGCAYHLHGEVTFQKIIKTPRGFREMML